MGRPMFVARVERSPAERNPGQSPRPVHAVGEFRNGPRVPLRSTRATNAHLVARVERSGTRGQALKMAPVGRISLRLTYNPQLKHPKRERRGVIRGWFRHGALSTKFRGWRSVFLHSHAGRQAVTDADRARRSSSFGISRSETPAPLHHRAIAILPEHLHAVMTLPANDTDFSARWQRIKGLFTRRLVATGLPFERDRRGEYGLWQKRFWEHTIRDDEDLARHIDYIHFNPVKHGLVSRVSAWRYSSFRSYVKRGMLPADWGGDFAIPSGSFGEPVT